MRVHVDSNYQTSARYDFLRLVEDDVLFAYVDSGGIAHIGVGINLQEHGRLILETLGFDLGGTTLSDAALAAEQGYTAQLLAAFNQSYSTSYPSRISPNNQALAAFNAILEQRAANSAYRPGSDLYKVLI